MCAFVVDLVVVVLNEVRCFLRCWRNSMYFFVIDSVDVVHLKSKYCFLMVFSSLACFM